MAVPYFCSGEVTEVVSVVGVLWLPALGLGLLATVPALDDVAVCCACIVRE